jgi:tRNA-binding protein
MDDIKTKISWAKFEEVDIRVGTVIKTAAFPEARKPAYIIWVDLGPLGIKKSSAQVTKHYSAEELVGKQVVCIVNFGDKQIGPLLSQVLITGFADESGDIILTTVDKTTPNGAKLI